LGASEHGVFFWYIRGSQSVGVSIDKRLSSSANTSLLNHQNSTLVAGLKKTGQEKVGARRVTKTTREVKTVVYVDCISPTHLPCHPAFVSRHPSKKKLKVLKRQRCQRNHHIKMTTTFPPVLRPSPSLRRTRTRYVTLYHPTRPLFSETCPLCK
jgi:hypothetical protein